MNDDGYQFAVRALAFIAWPVLVPCLLVLLAAMYVFVAVVLVAAWPALWFGRLVKTDDGGYRFKVR